MICRTDNDIMSPQRAHIRSFCETPERMNAIRKMLQSGISREMILSMDYSETELETVEKELLIQT